MNCLSTIVLAIVLALFIFIADAPASDDISYLINTVHASDCRFVRNGKEYPAENAADHLQTKYFRVKKRIKSAEQFIDKIASKSSISGKPYLVRCGEQDDVRSRAWFYRLLQAKKLDRFHD